MLYGLEMPSQQSSQNSEAWHAHWLAGGIPRCWDTSRDSRIHQTTNTILMVAPVGFKTNAETAVDNHFMKKSNMTPDEIEATVCWHLCRGPWVVSVTTVCYYAHVQCLQEFSEAHLRLTRAGVKVVLFCNERWYGTPDAVFPNNWFSTHSFLENDEGSMWRCCAHRCEGFLTWCNACPQGRPSPSTL